MSTNTILASAPLTSTGFHIKATGTTLGNSLIWDNGTNVGIGNTNTSYTLDVSGTGRFTGNTIIGTRTTGNIRNLNIYGGTNNNAILKLDGADGNGYGAQVEFISKNSAGTSNQWTVGTGITTGSNTFEFWNGSAVVMAATIAGNVGIGTSSPNTGKLEISTGGNRNVVISNDDTDTGYNIVSLNGSRTKGSYSGLAGGGTADNNLYLNSAVDVVFQTGASFTQRMRITSGGVVQIAGLTSNGTVATQSSNGSLYVSSDANLKIEDGFVENGLEKVLALKPRYFYWKDKEAFSADRQLGFYAQEVNAVSEETANTPAEGCGWGIYDRGLVALLTSAIQEMNTKLDEQNQTIQNLQEQINILAK